MKPFLDPKTFKKVKFVYSKNAESQKIMSELFEEDAIKSTFEDPNDYTHDDYAKLMQDDDVKSALHWKGVVAESKSVDAEIETESAVPSTESVKTEEPTTNGHTETPVEEAVPVATLVTPTAAPAPEDAPPPAAPAAPVVAAPLPAPVVAPVS